MKCFSRKISFRKIKSLRIGGTSVRLKDSNPRLKDSRVQSFSRNADGQGVCGKNEGFEGFFKVFYTEYYERPYLTEKSKISSWNMYVVLLCSETYLTLSTKISYFSLQQYRPHGRPAKAIIPKLIANRVPLNHYLCFNGTYSSSSNTFL